MHRSNGQGLLKAKINHLLKNLNAWGVSTHNDQPAQLGIYEFIISTPFEVSFHRIPFSSTMQYIYPNSNIFRLWVGSGGCWKWKRNVTQRKWNLSPFIISLSHGVYLVVGMTIPHPRLLTHDTNFKKGLRFCDSNWLAMFPIIPGIQRAILERGSGLWPRPV